MIAIDTNVLVRLLVEDAQAQAQVCAAKALLQAKGPAFISQIVQVETVWVLETAYGFDKDAVLKALKHLDRSPHFKLHDAQQFRSAIDTFAQHKADFSDCLILEAAIASDYDLYTFDRKLARLDRARLVDQNAIDG